MPPISSQVSENSLPECGCHVKQVWCRRYQHEPGFEVGGEGESAPT